MNKHWYNYGNIFKVKFRHHTCYKCDSTLTITKHRKVVGQKSEEAKYYSFDAGLDGGIMVGPCEFIHNVFYCSKCNENIEFVTQINQEDIDRIIKSVSKYFKKRGRDIIISKGYKNGSNELIVGNIKFNQDIYLCLCISEKYSEKKEYKIPIIRKGFYERPYYFNLNKKDLIDFIK